MQANVVELIRDLMKTQRLSIRKISARIAKEHGGSALGYTQQINRILNDPDYDPNFSTVQKILSALNCSFWQTPATMEGANGPVLAVLETRLNHISAEIDDIRIVLDHLHSSVQTLVRLSEGVARHEVPLSEPHITRCD